MPIAAAREFAKEANLAFTIRLPIRVKNFMEPYLRGIDHVGPFPGIPGEVRLRLAQHETPVDGRHIVLLGLNVFSGADSCRKISARGEEP